MFANYQNMKMGIRKRSREKQQIVRYVTLRYVRFCPSAALDFTNMSKNIQFPGTVYVKCIM